MSTIFHHVTDEELDLPTEQAEAFRVALAKALRAKFPRHLVWVTGGTFNPSTLIAAGNMSEVNRARLENAVEDFSERFYESELERFCPTEETE